MPRFAGAAAAQTVISNNRMTHEAIISENYRRTLDNKLRDRQEEAKQQAKRKLPYQNQIKQFYDKKSIQIFVAFLILLNFLISAINSQLLPETGRDDIALFIFEACEWFFAYAFLIELMVNFYGSYFWEFWRSPWNIFDFIIVAISLLSLYMSSLPGISVLRLFRAFRVVRLFKRIKTMRKMMDSIMKSLPGMAIAFSALFLIMGIYAIIGVNFWMEDFPDEFGNFLKAVLSLLQIMTFDSWCSGIARKIIFSGGITEAVYFISYVFIASIVMANVLIALLLDEFMNTSQQMDNEPDHDVDIEHDLDKLLEDQHAEKAKFILNDPKHEGLHTESNKIVSLGMMGQKEIARKDTPESACVVYPFDRLTPPGDKPSQTDIEMQGISHIADKRKPMKKTTKGEEKASQRGEQSIPEGQEDTSQFPNYSVNTTDSSDPINRADSEWRSKVDHNIKTLTRSLETFNTKFEQLHGKLDQLDFRLSGFFTLAIEAQKDKPAGGTK